MENWKSDEEKVKLEEFEDQVRDGSVSLRGRPVDRSKTGGWPAVSFIHMVVSADILCVIGLVANLFPYLYTTLQLSVPKIISTINNFMGIAFLLPVAWGYLADTKLGRYMTIVISSCILATGMVLLTLSAGLKQLNPGKCAPIPGSPPCPKPTDFQLNWFYAGMFLVSLGSAGLKPCITSMGQDQFDETHPKERKQGSVFFTSFYVVINLTSIVTVTVIFYLQSHLGYSWGWGVMTVYFAVAAIGYISAAPLFRHRNPEGSALTSVIQVLVVALKNCTVSLPCPDKLFELDDKEAKARKIKKLRHTKRLRFLDKAAICRGSGEPVTPDPWNVCTVTQVEELKSVIQILPIWACTIGVYTIFAQLISVTLAEVTTLDRRLGKNFVIPPASTGFFLLIVAVSFIPIYEFLIIPAAKKITGHSKGISDLKRMGIAIFLSMLSMICGALVEGRRLSIVQSHVPPYSLRDLGFIAADLPPGPLPMSVFWLLPQYGLLGIVEFMLGVAQLSFFYSETPESMRSLATSLYFSTISVGYFVSTGVSSAVNAHTYKPSGLPGVPGGGWVEVTGEFFKGGLKKYYYLLSVIMAIDFILFLIASHWYTHKVVEEDENDAKHEGDGKDNSFVNSKLHVNEFKDHVSEENHLTFQEKEARSTQAAPTQASDETSEESKEATSEAKLVVEEKESATQEKGVDSESRSVSGKAGTTEPKDDVVQEKMPRLPQLQGGSVSEAR